MRHRSALAAAVFLLSSAVATPALAATPRATLPACGAVLTSSVRLAADLVCRDGGGLTLAADGIELNLNGHSLVGSGWDGGDGVTVAARNVVVRNGTVSGWDSAVRADPDQSDDEDPPAEPAYSGTVRNVRLDGSRTGAAVDGRGSLVVQNSTLIGNGTGGHSQFEGWLRVEGSTVAQNGRGLFSFQIDRDGLVVRNSLIRDNGSGVACSQDGRYDVAGSTLQRNGTGLDLFECMGQVVNSRFAWNKRHVDGFLDEGDVISLRCNTYTRDGLPLPFPVDPVPCPVTP